MTGSIAAPSWKTRLLSLRSHVTNLFHRSDKQPSPSTGASATSRTPLFVIGIIFLLALALASGYYASIIINTPARETPRSLIAKRGLNFDGPTFIAYAERGNVTVVDLFLDAGIDINAVRPFDSYTALIGAAERGHTDVVKLLLERGANIKARDRSSQQALSKASAAGHLLVAQLLLSYNADVNAIDKYGATALKYAIKNNRIPVAELLRKFGSQEPVLTTKTPTAPSSTLIAKPQVVDLSSPVVPIAREFVVSPGQAGEIKLGMTAEGIRTAYAGSRILTDEIYTAGVKHPVFTVYLQNQATPALTVNIGNSKEKIATSIEILDETFKTTKGIGVGSTLGELRTLYSIANIVYEDGSFWANVPSAKLRFEIKPTAEVAGLDWLNESNTAKLPDHLLIQRIILY